MKKQPRVLIVEDEEVVATDLQECLSENGYEIVEIAVTGENAVSLAEELSPEIVLMDIRLAGQMDGIEAAGEIREKLGLPVVFLTAYSDPETLRRAKITEPFGYLLKPFRELDLLSTLEVALHKSGGVEPPAMPSGDSAESVKEASPEIERIASFLSEISPFNEIPQSALVPLAREAQPLNYESGELIVLAGEEQGRGFVVQSGRAALVKASSSGKELTVDLLPAGDSFGLIAALEKKAVSFSVAAKADTTLLWFPRASVLALLNQYPSVSKKFMETIFQRLRESHDLSRALAHDKVEVRVAIALLNALPKFVASDLPKRTIEMTRQELADMIGSTPETVIRVTKAMERDGMLAFPAAGQIQVVEKEQLEAIASH